MLNMIAHVKRLFGFTFCGFGDFKQLKPANEERIGFLNAWVVKHISNNSSCEQNWYIDVMKTHYFKMLINVLIVNALNSMITQKKSMIYAYVGLTKQWVP